MIGSGGRGDELLTRAEDTVGDERRDGDDVGQPVHVAVGPSALVAAGDRIHHLIGEPPGLEQHRTDGRVIGPEHLDLTVDELLMARVSGQSGVQRGFEPAEDEDADVLDDRGEERGPGRCAATSRRQQLGDDRRMDAPRPPIPERGS